MLEATVAVDLGGTNLRVGLVTPSGQVIDKESTSSRCDGDRLVDLMVEMIIRMAEKHQQYAIRGVGVSTGGLVKDGVIVEATDAIHGWRGRRLQEQLIERLPHHLGSVWVVNDGNASAQAEHHFGLAIDCDDFVVLTLGTGIGIGVCVQQQMLPYSEIHRHLERFFSGKLFEERPDELDSSIHHLAHYLSVALEILAPQKIILSGPIGRLPDFQAKFQGELRQQLGDFHFNRCQVLVSTLNDHGLLGASVMP